MSMLQNFFGFLAEYFTDGEQSTDPEEVKALLQEQGFGDVEARDVRDAVTLLAEEGEVFSGPEVAALGNFTGNTNFGDV
ncbi:MAG: hypothetical protein AAGA59_25475, partial [Actinomycetota bacterium]